MMQLCFSVFAVKASDNSYMSETFSTEMSWRKKMISYDYEWLGIQPNVVEKQNWFLSLPAQLCIHRDALVLLKDTGRQLWGDPVQYPDRLLLILCICICKHKIKKVELVSTLWWEINAFFSSYWRWKKFRNFRNSDLIINSKTSNLIFGISTSWAFFSWNCIQET